MQLTIEYLATSDLTPYANNSRTHSDMQIAQIMASIKEFGFTNPVLIDTKGGIIAGHGRVQAAQALGIEQVPCIRLGKLTKAQRRAYVIADNKIAMNAGWNFELLSAELDALLNDGFNLNLLGFDKDELNDLIGTANLPPPPSNNNDEKDNRADLMFKLTPDQLQQVETAIERAHGMGDYMDTGNSDSNGNALARICELFITQNGGN